MNNLFKLFNASSGKECYEKWKLLMKDIGLEISFSALGANDNKAISNIIDNINLERLSNNPMIVSRDDLKSLFIT